VYLNVGQAIVRAGQAEACSRRFVMHGIIRRGVLVAVVAASFLAARADADRIGFNWDFFQTLVQPQHDFEVKLLGNCTVAVEGGKSDGTNPFPPSAIYPPYRRTESFDGTYTTFSWSGGGSIPQTLEIKRHIGVWWEAGASPERHVVPVAAYWTPQGNDSQGRVPSVSSGVDLASGDGSLANFSEDEVTVLAVGYRLVDRTTLLLEDMNATDMPPETFTMVPLQDPVLSPGEIGETFSIPGLDPAVHAVVLLVETRFSGASVFSNLGPPESPYQNTGQWFENGGYYESVASTFVPSRSGPLAEIWAGITRTVGTRNIIFQLCPDAGGQPGAPLWEATFSDVVPDNFGELTHVSVEDPKPMLMEGTQYWLAARTPEPGTRHGWCTNNQGDSGVLGRLVSGGWETWNGPRLALALSQEQNHYQDSSRLWAAFNVADTPPTMIQRETWGHIKAMFR
jgi:hypothetical protein